MNQYDSCSMASMLDEKGYCQQSEPDNADIIIVNTCTVTGKTDQRARRIIRKLKHENTESILIVTGCYAEREPEIKEQIPEIDYIVGNSDKKQIGRIVEKIQHREEETKVFHSPLGSDKESGFFSLKGFGEHTRAFLKIQDGCSANCSYCIIPSVRGKSRSLPSLKVLKEATRLAELGYKEIVLTGIHIGMYGEDLDENINLTKLAEKLTAIDGIKRIRISSIEPVEISENLIKLVSTNEKMAIHFHIPLQSGSDRILKLMNRPYSGKFYLDLLNKLRKKIPTIGLGADVIVGFPGESDEDFQETVNLINSSPLNYLHVFRYSKRPGTVAANMSGQVHPATITKRSEILRNISDNRKIQFRKQFIGKELSCLTLVHHESEELIRAVSSNYIEVNATGNKNCLNKIVKIKITSVDGNKTFGTILSPPEFSENEKNMTFPN